MKQLFRLGAIAVAGSFAVIAFRLSAGAAPALASAASSAPSSAKRANNKPVSVQVSEARSGAVRVVQNGLGTVVSLYSASVKSRVSGQLVRVHFTEGELVKEGQLLAELDPRSFQAEVMQVEGQLARDRALLTNATLDLGRYEALGKESIARQEEVEARRSLVKQYEGALLAGQGLLRTKSLQLSFSRVTAPIGGRIGLRQVDPGNIVGPNDANGIAVINSLRPISVVFTLPEDVVPAVSARLTAARQKHESLVVEAWEKGNKARLAVGKLLTLDNQIDAGTGTVKLKAEFANEDLSLFPNQFVNVRLLLETRGDKVVVPAAAIQRGSQGTFVYAVTGAGAATVRVVDLGPADGNDVSIEKGLVAGERVVTSGVDRLREGAPVIFGKSRD